MKSKKGKPEGKVKKIKDSYHKLSMEFLSDKILLKDTSEGIYAAAACSTIYGLFKKLRLERYLNFCDLGSGDGRVVAVASRFTIATGIECDHGLIEVSKKMTAKLKLTHCNFIEGN